MIFELVQDFYDAVTTMPKEHTKHRILELLEEAARRDIHFIDRHPTTLFQCMWNTCWWYDSPETAGHYIEPEAGWQQPPPWDQTEHILSRLLETWRAGKERNLSDFFWIRSLRPPFVQLGGIQEILLHKHTKSVNSVAYSPNGRQIVSGSADETVRVWGARTGAECFCLQAHKGGVNTVAFSPNGKQIVSGSVYGFVNVWNSETGAEIMRFKMPEPKLNYDPEKDSEAKLYLHPSASEVYDCVYSPEGDRIVCAAQETINICDLARNVGLRSFGRDGKSEDDWVTCVAYSPDGNLIVCGWLDDFMIRVYEIETAKEILCLCGHSEEVTSVAFSPNGRWIVSGSLDHTVRLWNAQSGEERLCLRGHSGEVTSVAFSPNSQQIASGSKDAMVYVWDTEDGRLLKSLRGHLAGVNSVTYSPCGQRILTGSRDCTVRVWKANSDEDKYCLREHRAKIRGLTYSPDFRRLITWSEDYTVRVWDIKSGAEILCMQGHKRDVCCVVSSPKGEWIASGSSDMTVRVWDAETGEEMLCLCGHEGPVSSIDWSCDGARIASCSCHDKSVRVWDATNGDEMLCLCAGDAFEVIFSPDGEQVASRGTSGGLLLWDVKSGAILQRFPDSHYIGDKIVFSTDGQRILSKWSPGWLVYDLQTGQFFLEPEKSEDTMNHCSSEIPRGSKWHMLANLNEMTIKHNLSGCPVGWFPGVLDKLKIIAHPNGCTWVGCVTKHHYIITLEGEKKK